jgi:hypothetical protein
MQVTQLDPKDFIASLPADRREAIAQLDELITNAAPKAKKVMWEGIFWGGSQQQIIGYGEMTYVGSNKKEGTWFLVGLALQKNYITVFVNGVQNGQYIAEKYKDKLGKAKVGKSSISFTKLENINLDVLAEVVSKALTAA